VGHPYSISAVPALNHIFTNWTQNSPGPSAVASSSKVYAFTMQTNLALQANFVTNRFIGAAGNYYGLFSDTNGVAEESAGAFKLTVTLGQAYTLAVFQQGEVMAAAGTFDLGGNATATLKPKSGDGITSPYRPQKTARLTLDLNGGDVVSGSVSNA